MNQSEKKQLRIRRHRRVRAKIHGTASRPRLCVFRSNRHVELQLIDDDAQKTIASLRDWELGKGKKGSARVKLGEVLGEHIAKKAGEKGITAVVFDRGGYAYHGIIKAVSDGARKGGLIF